MPTLDPEIDKKDKNKEGNDPCKKWMNGILFSIAAISVGAAIYYGIRENKRLKREKELLEYEIWG